MVSNTINCFAIESKLLHPEYGLLQQNFPESQQLLLHGAVHKVSRAFAELHIIWLTLSTLTTPRDDVHEVVSITQVRDFS